MFGQAAHASNAYRRLAVESAALGADSHQLISMLFAGTQAAIAQARAALARGDIGAKALASSRAIRLVDEGLKVAVDRSVGELGESLYQLWEYCARRLLHAHLKHDDVAYVEVSGLIGQIESAWSSIGPNGASPTLRRVA
ncbi:MAG TPA: flagellar export chaperone FliS [Burkholderiaceae bacterium]|nr:flagellar export chaperone FliS [Burkholderiaceae bacterium]